MAAPIPLRPDFEAPLLRKLARGSRDPDQIRRLLALAENGGSRSWASKGFVANISASATKTRMGSATQVRWVLLRKLYGLGQLN